MMNLRVAKFGHLKSLWVSYLGLAGTACVALTGAAVMVEMIYHRQMDSAMGSELHFMGLALDAAGASSWFGAFFVLATGLGLFELCRRQFVEQWGHIQEDIEKQIQRQEAL